MTTYHCDFANGSDGADGSTGSPWKTLAHALTGMSNGDTLLVRGDSSDVATYYREDGLTCALSGVTIQNDTGHTPVWCASQRLTSWSKTGGYTNIYQAAFVGATNPGCANGSTILAPAADLAACDAATNSFYWASDVLYVNIGGDAPTAIEAALGVDWFMTISGASTLAGIICQWGFPFFWLNASGVTLSNVTCRYQLREITARHLYLRVSKDDCTVQNCTLARNLATTHTYAIEIGRFETVNNCTVDGCTISGGNESTGLSAVVVNSGTGHVVSDCTFTDTKTVVELDGAGASLTVSGSVFSDWISGGYALFVQEGTLVASRNRFYMDDAAGAKTAVRLLDNPTVGLYHNVFHRMDHDGTNSGRCIDIYPTADGMSVTAKNNAFNTSRYGIYYSGAGGFAEPTWNLDYNGFYSITTSFTGIGAGDQGTHNVTDDPLFTDAASYNYTIGSGSPYYDAGVAVAGINDDYANSAPDIGWYEVPASGAKKVAVRRSA